jgi:hypothetical protein
MTEERYDRWYTDNKGKSFYLENYLPDPEECKFLLMKVVEQSVRDYLSLEGVDIPHAKLYWESARDFIFDDHTYIVWGQEEYSLEDILDILDLDISWFRQKTKKRYRHLHGKRKGIKFRRFKRKLP